MAAPICQVILYFVLCNLLVSLRVTVAQTPVPYVEKYYDQLLDHFNFGSYGQKTFKQRYLVQDKWWIKAKGPIFFYTGNEGDITDFWDNTGFVFDIAPQFGALVLFAEHRYYGKSMPFGAESFKLENVGLLTIEQALADYALLLTDFKQEQNCSGCWTVAFGGSYGGMLSAWMRFKYPNVVHGAIAASAPIYLLTPDLDRQFFFEDVTNDYKMADVNCEPKVRAAFIELNDLAAQGQTGLTTISEKFKLCKTLESMADYTHLLGWIRNSFSTLAMLDYPYPTDFLAPVPANPVNVACQYMVETSDLLMGMVKAAGLFYNGTAGQLKCFDIFTEFVACADPTGCGTGPAGLAWDYQACTEIQLPGGTNNQTDMFPVLPFTPEMRTAYCQKKWNVTPRPKWGNVHYWGRDIIASSNIIFSNGNLDPWHRGGVLKNISDSVFAVPVVGGAHHLDLRGHNPKDPAGVIRAREIEKLYIEIWTYQH